MFNLVFVVRFLLASLAVYRLALMFTLEDGPFGLFDRFRLWLGKRAGNSDSHGLPWTLAELTNCAHCTGVWLAMIFFIPVIWPSRVTDIILIVLALAGLQSLLTGRNDIE